MKEEETEKTRVCNVIKGRREESSKKEVVSGIDNYRLIFLMSTKKIPLYLKDNKKIKELS